MPSHDYGVSDETFCGGTPDDELPIPSPPPCIHGERFPCAQCRANRSHNEASTGRRLTETAFARIYSRAGREAEERRDRMDTH